MFFAPCSGKTRTVGVSRALAGFVCAFSICGVSAAATLCVDTHSHGGCYTTITAAVAHAAAGDTVNVSQGIYAEDVHITVPISLIGDNKENTVILAQGRSNGIYIDGLNNPGLAHVVVTGFTVEYANFEGILVQNVSYVTIFGNIVRENDQSLQIANHVCPGLPAFETNEGDDCGEGIHLMGVNHSTVAGNLVQKNAGGILISDETAVNRDNAITGNRVIDNAFDCGITLASHRAYVLSGTAPLAFGIYHNTISGNESRHNGYGSDQGGAGVGLFAPAPGNVTTMNSVVGNRLIDNSLPGVAIHTHVNLTFPNHPPNPNANDNVITGNYISGNAADGDVGTTGTTGISVLGVTPVTGLVISNNVIENEQVDVGVNSASALDVHLNDFGGKGIGVEELNAAGTVNATENWWGCPNGPTAHGCATVVGAVVFSPWLTTPVQEHDHD
jgi:parallel beta-helix repeat protein